MKRNLLLLASSIVTIAILLEGTLRLFFPPPPTWKLPPTRHLRSPLLGWVLEPGQQSFTIDAPVSVNELGLRDDPIPLSKPDQEVRILSLGDSFTFALGVRFEDLYVQQLERILNERHPTRRFQVINAAVAGYNTRQELIFLLARGFALDPDLITVGFYWNDLVGNDEPLPDIHDTPWTEPGSEAQPAARHTLPRWLRDSLRSSVLLYQVVLRTKRLLSVLDPPVDRYALVQRALLSGNRDFLEPYWQETETRLLELATAAGEHGVPVILMVFPMENQIRRHYPELDLSERLREIWRPTGFPFLDLEDAYRRALQRGDNPFLPYDLHPSPEGMQIAAEALYDTIRLEELLPNGSLATE